MLKICSQFISGEQEEKGEKASQDKTAIFEKTKGGSNKWSVELKATLNLKFSEREVKPHRKGTFKNRNKKQLFYVPCLVLLQ